jgi:hypothetical protein
VNREHQALFLGNKSISELVGDLDSIFEQQDEVSISGRSADTILHK